MIGKNENFLLDDISYMKTPYDIFHKLFSAYFHKFSKIAYENNL
jgi:hypothetical protein